MIEHFSKSIFVIGIIMLAAVGCTQEAVQEAVQEPTGPQYINIPGRSDDLPYSNAVLVGNTLYLAGSIGIDPETGVVPSTISEEVKIVLDGMKQRLEMVSMTMDDLVSVQVFCPDLSLYEEFNAIYRTYFTNHFPARAFIGSGILLRGGHFEIQGIAVKQ